MRLSLVAFLALLVSTTTMARQAESPTPATTQTASPPPAGREGGGRRGGRGGVPRVVPIPNAPELDYAAVPDPLRLPEGMTYGVVASLGVAANGHVFLYHRMPVPIVEFDGTGTFVRGLREGTDTRAHSLRIDSTGHIWIVDSGDHTVTKLTPDGAVVMTLGTKGVTGSGDEAASKPLFNIPSDIAIAPNGDLFVAQGEAGGPDPRVIRFDRTGKFITTWSLAYKEGVRSNPHAIEVDKDGLIYVADREVMRIRVFRPDGTAVRDIQMQNLVCGLFIDRQQQLWVATGTDGMVFKVGWDGTVLGRMGTGGRGAGVGLIGEGHMLAVAPSGDVYVADSINRTVHKFTPRSRGSR